MVVVVVVMVVVVVVVISNASLCRTTPLRVSLVRDSVLYTISNT